MSQFNNNYIKCIYLPKLAATSTPSPHPPEKKNGRATFPTIAATECLAQATQQK